MRSEDLKRLETHYEFGKNWASFAETIDTQSIRSSEEGVLKLLTPGELAGKSFLDIGCGSGLHSLAASRLGVARLLSTDIDPNCIATAKGLIERYPAGIPWDTAEISVFEIAPEAFGRWDIVYSWGVLHHTGAMYEAIERASRMVKPGGLFVFALYRRTSAVMDKFWTIEKRWYTNAKPAAKERANAVFTGLLRQRMRLSGTKFDDYVAAYKKDRGAHYSHDVSDWLGGYPYEVISPDEVEALMAKLGFAAVRSIIDRRSFGLFGSGCDQFTYRRTLP